MGNGFLQNFVGTVVYLVAQFLGMFVAAALSYWVYSVNEKDAYEHFDGDALNNKFGNDIDRLSQKNYEFSCLYSTCPKHDVPNSHVRIRRKKTLKKNI